MEGMTYRHQLNPAFMNESNYINLPFFVLGNFNVGLQGNVGVNDFLYKYNQNLHTNNHLSVNLRMPIIAFGFRGFGGFNTFEIAFRSNTSVNLPYGLFDFMKTGMSDEGGTHYRVKDLTVRSNNYAEVALGHS